MFILHHQATVQKLLQQSFQDEKTKGCFTSGIDIHVVYPVKVLTNSIMFVVAVNNDALQVMAEMLRTFVAEAAARAGQQAKVIYLFNHVQYIGISFKYRA